MNVWRRTFDLFCSLLGLVILSPLFAAIAVAIKLQDGGPVFFRQTRVGYKGVEFKIWKFRTMVVDAERLGRPLTVAGDPRITRIGQWLRKYKLDELPQLINVVAGQMSLVGPRPEVSAYVKHYSQDQIRVLDLVPGITDPASLRFRNESELLRNAPDPEQTYLQEIMPAKVRLNLEYAARASLKSDLYVIIETLFRVLFGK